MHPSCSCRHFGLALCAALALAALSAGPAFAGQGTVPAAPAATIAPVAAPAQPGCGQALDLSAAIPTTKAEQGEVCPAAAPADPTPIFLGGRTCRCSCGQPCHRDEDCGPGGICAGGITCC
jgi:hypothetical protein